MLLSSWPGCTTQTNSVLNIKINRNHYKFTKKIQFSLTGDKLGTKPRKRVDNEGNKWHQRSKGKESIGHIMVSFNYQLNTI